MSEETSIVEVLIKSPPILRFWPDAGEILGYTRAGAYFALKHGRFEVPILRRGSRHFVLRSELLKFLGVADPLTAPREHSEREAV